MASRKSVLIAFALGLLASSVVSAQPSSVSWPNVVLKYATDGTPLLHPRVAAASTAAGGGAATLNAAQKLAIGNAVANLQLTRNVPLANVAKLARIAAWGAGPIALLSLTLTGLEWASDHWINTDPQPDASNLGITWYGNQSFSYPAASALDACNAYNAASGRYCIRTSGDEAPNNLGAICETSFCAEGFFQTRRISDNSITGNNQYVYYRLAPCSSGATRDPDTGVCMTEGSAAADEATVEQRILDALQSQPSLAGQVLDRALEDSQARVQLAAGSLGITGPATVDGGSSTSTRVDTAGTTTIQTQTTYNLSYQGDTVNLTQTQVETVTDPANNVTTTTTTTDTPAGDPPPPDEPPDLCAENPDASGCAPFGTPEPPTPLPQEDRTVSVAPEMSAAGACPAPHAFTIAGQSFQLTYDGACEFAQGIRPVVLAVAWMGAFVFLFSIGRAQTS